VNLTAQIVFQMTVLTVKLWLYQVTLCILNGNPKKLPGSQSEMFI